MILKVKGKTEAFGDWWIFDCYKIHYHQECVDMVHNKVSPYATYPDKDGNPVWVDWNWDFAILKDDSEVNPRPVVVANLGTIEGQEHIVTFDTIAYLCNDKGETIEKIEP